MRTTETVVADDDVESKEKASSPARGQTPSKEDNEVESGSIAQPPDSVSLIEDRSISNNAERGEGSDSEAGQYSSSFCPACNEFRIDQHKKMMKVWWEMQQKYGFRSDIDDQVKAAFHPFR